MVTVAASSTGPASAAPAGPGEHDEGTSPQLPAWALPNELAVLEGWPRGRRTPRDWLADALVVLGAALLGFYAYQDSVADPDPGYLEVVPGWMHAIDPWVGVIAVGALWWRRRAPVALGVAMIGVMVVSSTGYGAVLALVLTLAIHRGWVPATLLAGVVASLSVLFALSYQPPQVGRTQFIVTALLLTAAPLSWGLVVRFRRQLIASLRRDAQRQRDDQQRRLAETRRAERQRIAWEMHDVLAHRISLLSVHAGALAFRSSPDATKPPSHAELRAAVQVIRDNAHQALDELGEVLSVLRADDDSSNGSDGAPRTASPLLSHLPALIDEARAAGQTVVSRLALGDDRPPRPQEQRTVYRFVQEGLTNARKHAPDAPVTVSIDGAPGGSLVMRVANALGATGASTPPGTGAGLAGLRERVELDGGTLEHGVVDGEFRLTAELPWRT